MNRFDNAEQRFRRKMRLSQKVWTSNIQPNPAGGSPAADPTIRLGRFGSSSLWCARMPTSYILGWWAALTALGRWAVYPASETSQWVVLGLIAFTVFQGVAWSRSCRIAVRLSEDETTAQLPERYNGMPEVYPDPVSPEPAHYRNN